jgi:putative ABC transport system permease protein
MRKYRQLNAGARILSTQRNRRRLAMGASRSRLIRQLLTECVLLSTLGALFGILLARWGCVLLVRFISTSQDPIFLQLSLDGRILAFTACIAIATGLLFGLVPALGSTRVSLTSAMKGSESDESQRRSHVGAGRWIVSIQVAISLVILITAGLFLRSFRNLVTLDLGFDRSNVLLVETTLPLPNDSPTKRASISREILERLKSLPGATSASESVVTPVSGYMWGLEFSLPKGGGPTGDDSTAYMNFVSPEYFATFRSPILAGRCFNDHDVAGAPSVIIINEAMAHRFFGNSQPVGQFLITDDVMRSGSRQKTQPLQIVGVIKDSKYRTLRERNESIAYFPMAQSENLDDARTFEIRTATDPAAFSKSAEQVFTGINKNISLNFQTLETQVDDSLRQDHLLATLSGFFGALALLLAMIGLYGVLAYTVTQRRKEFGIRIALGAQKISIVRLIMRDLAILLGVGISGGIAISYWAARLMEKMLFGLEARDAGTMIASAAVLISVALIAAYLPARRATQTDPMLALRDE